MKLRTTLIITTFLLAGFMLQGQEIPEVLKKRNEIYFSFEVKSHDEINALSGLISIDNVQGTKVRAYANTRQYLEFVKMGYKISPLPAPGDGPGVVMNGNGIYSPLTTWDNYPTYPAYESLMAGFQAAYPALCHLDTIATLASGRRLLVLKISDNVATDEGEPEFFYSSSMHGDETTGYVSMLHLADYLLSNYGTDPQATDIINTMEIFICPLANPDGTYYGGNSTVSGARRYNINGIDLNRNYPDPQNGPHPDGNAWQAETVAFMDFAGQHHFVAGANFHGGAEVVNYPWDTWATLHPDNNWFYFISREYADTVHANSPATYMDDLNNGITNGYAWYEVNGGRQDYMNYYHHCREITIEISATKLLPATQLLTHWNYNWRSFFLWLKEARYGIHGTITDQVTGLPVAAKVFIVGHDFSESEVYSSANLGDYHRPVKAGTYTLEISAPCYQTQTVSGITVSDFATVTLNIQLTPGASAAVSTAAATAVTSAGAVSGGDVTCSGNTPVTAKGVCWGTSLNPLVTGNHTVNGSGPGTFTSQINGLSASTAYHVRAYATNSSGTYYGADLQFTTICGAVTTFPWNEGFENGGAIPACWTQEQVNGSGVNWTFITGSGNNHPATAHGGTYNACLKINTTGDHKTRLITPPLNLSTVPAPQLKFWHTQALWAPDQDQLAVFYKTSAGGTWTLLTTYTNNITAWTQRTILLPFASSDYYIAFEGNAKYGYGVCVDDVQVSTSCASIYPVSVSISASANPVIPGTPVTFTATPVNGGSAPSFQWKVNGTNAGNNNTLFAFTPDDGDEIQCVLTASEPCTSSNPAGSNTIIMAVNSVPLTLFIQNSTVTGTQCFNAAQTINVAGGGSLFTVEPGGSVTMIAGQNILYNPGTIVAPGGYVNGYISPAGPWCSTPPIIAVPSGAGSISPATEQPFYRIYPNPTAGKFMVELTSPAIHGKWKVEIFDMNGEKLLSQELTGERNRQFSLSGRPAGIFLVRVLAGELHASSRIIRQD